MSQKDEALQEIAIIARNNKLTIAEIAAALAPALQKEKESSGILSRAFNYLGGILIFAGICTFVGFNWDHFGSAARVLITLGTGFAAFLFALAAMDDEKYDRAATPLLLVAALFQPMGIFVMLAEYSSGGEPLHGVLFMAAVMLIQQGVTFWAKKRTTLAFTTIFFASIFFVTLLEIWDVDDTAIAFLAGVSLLCTGFALGKSPHRPIAGFWYFWGSIFFLFSIGDTVQDKPYEIVFLAASTLIVYFSTVARSRTLLAIGTLGMLGYIGYFASEHFRDDSSFAVLLILLGVAFFGLGAMAIKLNKKFIAQKG